MSSSMQTQPLQTANSSPFKSHIQTPFPIYISYLNIFKHQNQLFNFFETKAQFETTTNMASEQVSRRENTTSERDIHVEKDRVPKMTTHFEHLSVKDKDPPQGSIEALQGGELGKDHAGKAIGDVGGRGKARETHELGTNFESLADKVKKQGGAEREHRGGAETVRRGGARGVGKFEMNAEGDEGVGGIDRNVDREELDRRTRVITGATENKEKNRGVNTGQVVEEKGRSEGKIGAENAAIPAGITMRFNTSGEKGERGREEETEKSERSYLEEISKYRAQAQQKSNDVISAAQERYERAKQATNEALSTTTQTAQERTAQAMEKASQAKDTTIEKGQQGYAATKDTISSVAKTAAEYTAPAAEKAKGYTAQAAEMAKSATGTTAQYVGEKAVQAKDVTMETGKTAAEYAGRVAADLKDKATAVGWTAANYSAELTVEGTKAAANVVEGVAGYAGHKAAELASKSVDTVKGLAASAGETAKEYTARKKEEGQRELEAKKAAQPQVLFFIITLYAYLVSYYKSVFGSLLVE